MEKRCLSLIFLIFLLLPVVSAEISITSSFKEKYNIGEKILISSSVKQTIEFQGILEYNLNCGNTTSQLLARSIRLDANEEKTFNEEIPATIEGSCNILINLFSYEGNITETKTSSSFTITKELQGDFSTDKQEFQLGDSITIRGTVKRLNNENVNGIAIVYIKLSDKNYIVDTADIENGEFSLKENLVNLPAGTYSIDANIFDSRGNNFLFGNIKTFTLYNELIISASLDKATAAYLPGENVKLSGDVKKRIGDNLTATLSIIVDNVTHRTDILNNEFSYNLKLESNIKSGYHDIVIVAEDELGNYGEKTTRFEVIAVPTRLTLAIDKTNYLPEEKLKITTTLYDQADDVISRVADIKITDPKNNLAFSKTYVTTDSVEYGLDKYALPGTWLLTTESSGLKSQVTFTVDIVEKLDVNLVGQVLHTKNIGNTKYKKDLVINVNNGEKEIKKALSLDVNEETSFDLIKDLKPGKYNITVLDKNYEVNVVGEESIFDKITGAITGLVLKEKGKSLGKKYGIIVLAVIVLTMVIYLIKGIKGKKEAIKEEQPKPKKIKQPQSKFGKADEDDIKDFKRRMLRDIRRQEKMGKINNFDLGKAREDKK